jgi:hypothetical protein
MEQKIAVATAAAITKRGHARVTGRGGGERE